MGEVFLGPGVVCKAGNGYGAYEADKGYSQEHSEEVGAVAEDHENAEGGGYDGEQDVAGQYPV